METAVNRFMQRSLMLRDAKMVFETTWNELNVDSWNAMFMGYMQNGLYKFVVYHMAAGVLPHESHESLLEKLRIAFCSSTFSSMT